MGFMRGALREVLDVAQAATATHLHLRGRIAAIAVATLVMDVLGTAAMYFAERGAPGGAIHTVGDAAFFTTTQLLSVSSSMPNPVTGPGRIVDVVLEAYAVTVVAGLAGSLGAFFHTRGAERRAAAEADAAERAGGDGQ